MDDIDEGTRAIFQWGGAIAAVVIIVALVLGVLRPTFIAQERQAVQQSQGYITTKQTLLLKLVSDYTQLATEISQLPAHDPLADAKRAQQRAIAQRLKLEVSTLPRDQVPQLVKDVLQKEGL